MYIHMLRQHWRLGGFLLDIHLHSTAHPQNSPTHCLYLALALLATESEAFAETNGAGNSNSNSNNHASLTSTASDPSRTLTMETVS